MDVDWATVDVAGHPCEVFDPKPAGSAPSSEGVRSVILYLHGVHSSRLSESQVFCRELARLAIPVICPQTGRSWWTDRICSDFDPERSPERYVLDDVLPYIANRWGVKPPQIALLGTSMGGQGALRLAFRHASKFPVIAAISPAIDFQIRWREGDESLRTMYDDEETARQDTATLLVHPLNWPRNLWFCCDPADPRWFESADRLRMKLGALGIPKEIDLTTTGGGHGWEYYERMAPAALGFIAERLQRESRRVV